MSNSEMAIQPKLNLIEPPLFKVIYVNDNQTSMQFVIDSLIEHFHYTNITAERIANTIHSEGAAVAAILPFEIAEQKGIEVTANARKNGYPLQVRLEQEK